VISDSRFSFAIVILDQNKRHHTTPATSTNDPTSPTSHSPPSLSTHQHRTARHLSQPANITSPFFFFLLTPSIAEDSDGTPHKQAFRRGKTMTEYANIWITGGSRPLFSRPMGERGSSHKPSVIQIFAYAGYKRGVHSRVQSLLLGSLRVWTSPLLRFFWTRGWTSSGALFTPAVPRRHRRDEASAILPSDPEHQQFPSPIPR